GVPVLVKMSYFPNWRAGGADGPSRVAPNVMVVIPNDTHVELSYGRTGVEGLSYALTLLGIVGVVLLVRRPLARFAGAGGGGPVGAAQGPAGEAGEAGAGDELDGPDRLGERGDGADDRPGAEPAGAEASG
ncbi:MAG TPA: hypothetical protein VFZ30_14490, partial [Acidimicrobiales bacterium]